MQACGFPAFPAPLVVVFAARRTPLTARGRRSDPNTLDPRARPRARGSRHARLREVGAVRRAARVDERAVFAVDLAIEELVGNLLRHGAPESRLWLEVAAEPTKVKLRLEDTSFAFDPTRAPPPPSASSIDDAPIGGRGIAMVRRVVDRPAHERRDGRNIVEIAVLRTPESVRHATPGA